MKRTYRQWVAEGARGFFLTASVAVNAVRLINPLDRSGGYFVRRDTASPDQHALRERLPDHERQEVSGGDGQRREQVGWILTTQVERPAELVKRGWLTWDAIGEVIERPVSETSGETPGDVAGEAVGQQVRATGRAPDRRESNRAVH